MKTKRENPLKVLFSFSGEARGKMTGSVILAFIGEMFGMAPYFVDHTAGVWPQAAGGIPFTATEFASKGDAITDLHENLAAEQKARTTYDNILRLVDDPDVVDVIRFLRQREVTHYQRFGEALERLKDQLNEKNFYAFNPSLKPPASRPAGS